MTFIYEYAREILALEAIMEENPDDAVLRETLESLQMDEKDKMLGLAKWAKELESQGGAILDAADRMREKAGRLNARANRLQELLLGYMRMRDLPVVEDEFITAKIKKNPASVVIDQGAAIPIEYMNPPPEPAKATPSKKLLKAALENGVDIPGVRLDNEKYRLDLS